MPILVFGSRGIYVELLQSTLKKIGFYNGAIDGIFGQQTLDAVYYFQSQFGISVDGVVGKETWRKLEPYMNGTVGNIVPTDMSYPYEIMMMNLEALKNKYPIIKVGYYAESVMGKKIPFVKIGRGEQEVFYSGGMHANEWINSVVMMKFIEEFAQAYEQNAELIGYNVREIFKNRTIYIVPMVNPDGIDLVLNNIPQNSFYYKDAVKIAKAYPDIPFPDGWKANIRGVDLNQQFPADWEKAKESKFAQGFTTPAPRDFVGTAPLTQPESIGIYDFTLKHNFRLVLAYHTQGEVIFWRYQNFEPEGSKKIADEFVRVSGYELVNDVDIDSYAGYRDWFISYYNKPGYTIETGLGVNPLPISQFTKIYNDNLGILILGSVL